MRAPGGVYWRSGVAALAGAATVAAFAPWSLFPVALLGLAVLVALLECTERSGVGLWLGWCWGMGLFLAGVSWLYIALNRYGGVPMPLAALAIVLFCAYLAAFPALASALYVRFRSGSIIARALLFAALWALAELLRGWLFTGFPWLAIGYTQTPPSPLAGWLPIGGVYFLAFVVTFCAAVLGLVRRSRLRESGIALLVVCLWLVGGRVLKPVVWTEPHGDPVEVALLQTNVEQDLKWRPELTRQWLQVNAQMAGEHAADIVVLPETSLPMLVDQLPDAYLEGLAQQAADAGGDVILGAFSRDAGGNVFNSAFSVGRSSPQFYAKRHLVPFGEYSPPLFGWFYRFADIPMSDQTPGGRWQPPMTLAGQQIAVNICYEDLFGRELLDALPQATLMLNMSNLAWYGESLAQPQHLQISRARALETGRPMLRATNTGMTAWIEPDGRVMEVLPQFERGALIAEVRGYQGLTPYARWGDWPVLVLAAAVVLGVAARRRRRA